MFGSRVDEKTVPDQDHPLRHSGASKVLKLDFKPEKAEAELTRWVAAGWTLRSTEAVLLNGQTVFVLAFLERTPRKTNA